MLPKFFPWASSLMAVSSSSGYLRRRDGCSPARDRWRGVPRSARGPTRGGCRDRCGRPGSAELDVPRHRRGRTMRATDPPGGDRTPRLSRPRTGHDRRRLRQHRPIRSTGRGPPRAPLDGCRFRREDGAVHRGRLARSGARVRRGEGRRGAGGVAAPPRGGARADIAPVRDRRARSRSARGGGSSRRAGPGNVGVLHRRGALPRARRRRRRERDRPLRRSCSSSAWADRSISPARMR